MQPGLSIDLKNYFQWIPHYYCFQFTGTAYSFESVDLLELVVGQVL